MSLFELYAWAVTVAENGEIGLMDGNMGMGAAFAGIVPLVQVALLFANGRALIVILGSDTIDICGGPVVAWIGEGRGDVTWGLVECVGTAGPLSLLTNDFRNQEDFEDNGGLSMESFRYFESTLECFLDSNRDLGRNGSAASAKYSCCSACAEVGRLFGSHIKHQVTKLLSPRGH